MDETGKNYESILNTIKYDMRQDIIYGAFPSLQYKTFNNLAVTLWRDKLEQADLTLFNYKNVSENLSYYAKKIVEMISNLSSIPILFKPQLKEMVGLIGKEVEIFYKNQVYLLYFESLNTFKVYWNNLCWNDQNTINKIKTVNKIIDSASVSTIEKYILACNYCLEDKIDNLLKLLPENFIEFFEGDIYYKLFLVVFWTYYKRGEIERFSKFPSEINTYTFLLKCATYTNMETAVQYIWEKFADLTVKSDMLDVIKFYKVNPNIAFYILQNMNENVKDKVSLKIYCSYLSKLHSISRWCNIVPLIKYVSELNSKTFTVTQAFEVATFCWHKKFFDDDQFSDLWNEICIKFELTLEEKIIDVCVAVFLNYFCVNGDLYVEKLLLGMCTSENKRRLLNNESIIAIAARLIVKNGTDRFDFIFKEFFELEDYTLFKRNIYSNWNYFICRELIYVGNYKILNEYLIKFYPEERISKFKNEYHSYDRISLLTAFRSRIRNVDPLESLNKYLNWSFEGNDEKINKFIAKVYDLESSEYRDVHCYFFMEFKRLINKNKWEIVEKCWNWIFLATEEKIVSTEEKFARIKKIFGAMFRSTRSYLITMKYCTLFKMIISLCFKNYKVEEIVKVGNRENDVASLVNEYLEFDNHLELNDLVGGSFYLKETIDEFKTSFMISHRCSLMFEMTEDEHTIFMVNLFFKWFNPSVQSANLFKKRFCNFIANKKNYSCNILNKREKENVIMMVRQYLIKMLKTILNLKTFFKEINENKIIKDNSKLTKIEGKKKKNEDTPFQCRKNRIEERFWTLPHFSI